jgi:hypothetical protein
MQLFAHFPKVYCVPKFVMPVTLVTADRRKGKRVHKTVIRHAPSTVLWQDSHCSAVTDVRFVTDTLERMAARAYSFEVQSCPCESTTVHRNVFQRFLSSPLVSIKFKDCNATIIFPALLYGCATYVLIQRVLFKAVLITADGSLYSNDVAAPRRAAPQLKRLRV